MLNYREVGKDLQDMDPEFGQGIYQITFPTKVWKRPEGTRLEATLTSPVPSPAELTHMTGGASPVSPKAAEHVVDSRLGDDLSAGWLFLPVGQDGTTEQLEYAIQVSCYVATCFSSVPSGVRSGVVGGHYI